MFTGTDTYEAHSTLCIDLMAEGMPITTLGLKPIDVFVDEFEDAYVLVDNQADGNNANLETFKLAQSSVDQEATYVSNTGLSIWKLFSGKTIFHCSYVLDKRVLETRPSAEDMSK